MKRSTTAALTRFAAICGLLAAPSAAAAQLQCQQLPTDIQIRRVAFEGNATFTDAQLALHVVSTPTDVSARVFSKRVMIPAGAALGAAVGLTTRKGDLLGGGLGFGAVGGFLGFLSTRVAAGVERCLRRGLLAGDILNLGGFYRDQGFPDIRVDTVATIDGKWVDILFRVTEGRPALVDSLEIRGYDTTTMGRLPDSLNSRKGQRYSPTRTQEDIDSLETRLRNSGYPNGIVTRNVDRPSPYNAIVRFDVDPGPRARIGKITVSSRTVDGGAPSVAEQVVRDLLQFAPGDIYSERALFVSERRFYRIGSFQGAEIAPNLTHVGQDSLVDVQVNVVEDLTRMVSSEPGFGTLDCLRFRSSYSDRAFLNGVNRFDLTGSVSKIGLANKWPGAYGACRALQDQNRDPAAANEISSRQVNYNGTVRFTRPIPLRGGLLPSLSMYTERRGGFQAYMRTTIIGSALNLSRNLTSTIQADASYNLEYGHTDAAETVLCFLFQACDESARAQLTQGDKRLAVLGLRLSRDQRNSVDSASAGTVLRLDLRTSRKWFLSDTSLEFNKGVLDASWYHRVLGAGVLAVRVRAGLVGGGQQTGGVRLPPPQERLYAGGETSVRGFRQNELGPVIYVTNDSAQAAIDAPDDSVRTELLQALTMRIIPAGGNAMYVGNLEYRLPGPFLRTLQTVLFVDVGALSTSGLTTITGSNQFRVTPGVAIKYFSPVGPVQINFGYNSYNPLAGPVYWDRGGNETTLTCASGVVTNPSGAAICQPLPAIAPKNTFFKRITLTVAFPPDF